MTTTTKDRLDTDAWPSTPDEIAAADAEMRGAQALQAELIEIVQRHVDDGLSPAAAAEALKATTANAIAEIEGNDDVASVTAGHILRRFGGDLANLFAKKIAQGKAQ
ncbi:hypothetical protein [Roseovarius sp. SYSU LYC5161]|uniref:hypothetical protein n=1 Tax=Roseovarius halophilus (ex Wu et al. 2025) TaxID=3376060 RepID=UPI003999AE7C